MSRAPDAHSGREFCCLPGPGALGIQLCTGAAHDGQRYNGHQRAVIGNAGPPTGLGASPGAHDRFEDPAMRGAAANALDHDEHYAADDIDASFAFVESLAGMDDDEILAALLGEDHGGEMRGGGVPIALGPQLHRDFAFTSGPVPSMLEHGGADDDSGSGVPDSGVPDVGSVGEISTSSAKAPDFSWIMEAAMRSMQSKDDEKDAKSQDQQLVTTAVDTKVMPLRKRMRDEGSDEDEALLEKKRRVPTEEQPGSPAALPLPARAPMSATNNAGPSTAATRTVLHIDTAAATAPGAAVVEPTARVANGVNEAPITLPLHSAMPSQAVVPTVGLGRRIKRAAMLAAIARERAAAAVRAAVAAELSPRRRGKAVRGRGKGMAKTRA